MKAWRYLEIGTLVAGLLGVGVWLGSIAESALYQNWQNWAFDHQLRGEPASFGLFLAEQKVNFDRFLAEERMNLDRFLAEQRNVREAAVNFVARSTHRHSAPPPAGYSPPVTPSAPVQPPASVTSSAPVPPPSPVTPSAPDRGLIGRLTIPRLHLTAIVREGIAEKTLRVALGHIPGTALPGMRGNIALAGHRDTLFRPLRQVRRDDVIRLESLTGTYVYRVEKTEIVWPRNVSVLRVGPQPELTLVTCYPFYYVGVAPKRFIVIARQISAIQRAPETQQRGSQRTDARSGESFAPPV
jgi:sortase A